MLIDTTVNEDGTLDLISDLVAAGFRPLTFDETPYSQDDQNYFVIRDFLSYCIRLTNEKLIVSIPIAAEFARLKIPANLYERATSYDFARFSFNVRPR